MNDNSSLWTKKGSSCKWGKKLQDIKKELKKNRGTGRINLRNHLCLISRDDIENVPGQGRGNALFYICKKEKKNNSRTIDWRYWCCSMTTPPKFGIKTNKRRVSKFRNGLQKTSGNCSVKAFEKPVFIYCACASVNLILVTRWSRLRDS